VGGIAEPIHVQVSIGFCSRCGNQVSEGDLECRACGADTIEANVIVVLKRISARRSRRGHDDDADDRIFPL
jgi:uncharacterized protein YbcC (UPF0753/DUF2309 family)